MIVFVTPCSTIRVSEQELEDAGLYFGRGWDLYPVKNRQILQDFLDLATEDHWDYGDSGYADLEYLSKEII